MSQYDPVPTERKWQQKWKEWGIYRFDFSSSKPVYSIDNPPRYTSGALHLGHATGYSLIDFAARYRRMRGYNVFFPLCFDVNGTPTEVKVEREYGITKLSVPRQEYIRLCKEYAESFIDEMTRQFEILGTCMDPSIYYQTDAPYYRRITQISFLRMLKKGLVYKGTFPVNWCPRCITALADAEVEYEQNVTNLNFIKFRIKGTDDYAVIATTRPELICTCQIVAVHPDDEKHKTLIGKTLLTPLYEKEVTVIADNKVDPGFGSGVVMICTIGDKDDLEWVMKYNLPLEKGIDEQGKMTEIAGPYAGLKVKEARKRILEDLKNAGLLVKQIEIEQNVGTCWRCHEPIEFLQIPQWFLKTLDFKDEVLAKADEIRWFPEFMKIRLRDWVMSLEWDWVISRQRYFATPIPVWECMNCGEIVPAREEDCYVDPTVDPPPVESCPKCGGPLKGCEDVFDTWMDSSISPLYNTFWLRDEERFKKLYPMSLRPQSHDIIRTWAFYTILREYLLVGERPWNDIMIHGFIMAADGTPMHASKGNVIDPMPILEKNGADALRYYACTCSLGEDNAFREKDVVHGGRLCTKLWNIGKFVGSVIKEKPKPCELSAVDKWILSKYSRVVKLATEYCENYSFDKAMREIEQFAWHEFADHYIEMVKYRAWKEDDEGAKYTLYTVCLGIMKMFAPFLPHVTEEVYQTTFRQFEGDISIHVSMWPEPVLIDEASEEKGEFAKEIISAIRSWKAEKGIPLNETLRLVEIIGEKTKSLEGCERDIMETVRAAEFKVEREAKVEEIIVGLRPIKSKIGPRFKERAKEVSSIVSQLSTEEIAKGIESGRLEITLADGTPVTLEKDMFEIEKKLMLQGVEVETIQVGEVLVAIRR
ncbi:MAG: valine--tRNA ligase [Methanomassiliicoccales archaeon]|jgi:valyl-tRNA synthetase|nr:valine--tRNA ligase [Methanomassiliicoccales archaeon]